MFTTGILCTFCGAQVYFLYDFNCLFPVCNSLDTGHSLSIFKNTPQKQHDFHSKDLLLLNTGMDIGHQRGESDAVLWEPHQGQLSVYGLQH